MEIDYECNKNDLEFECNDLINLNTTNDNRIYIIHGLLLKGYLKAVPWERGHLENLNATENASRSSSWMGQRTLGDPQLKILLGP